MHSKPPHSSNLENSLDVVHDDVFDASSDYQYVGWVPCVTGQICYGFAESNLGLDDTKFSAVFKEFKNIRSCNKHQIALISIVNWKDRSQGDGLWQVFLVARTDKDSNLVGSVFIYPKEKREKIQDKIALFHQLRSHDGDDINGINENFSALKNELELFSDKEFYQINFQMNESGIARFSVIKGGDNQEKQLDDYVLCRQSFYYLKFSLHKHKHHPDNVDSLTTIHPLTEPNVGRSLVFDLKQSLIDIKRSQDVSSNNREFNFSGITSYMRSLIQACLKENLMTKSDYEDELKFVSNTERSYQSLIDKKAQEHTSGFNSRSEGRQFLILLFAVLAPWAITFSLKGEQLQNSFLSKLLHSIYTDDFKTIVFIVIIILLYLFRSVVTYRFSSYSNLTAFLYRRVKSIVHEPRKASIIAIMTLLAGFSIIIAALYKVFMA